MRLIRACRAQNLDFDFEKCCSVSLSAVNVYACLVCGKYFQVYRRDQCYCIDHVASTCADRCSSPGAA